MRFTCLKTFAVGSFALAISQLWAACAAPTMIDLSEDVETALSLPLYTDDAHAFDFVDATEAGPATFHHPLSQLTCPIEIEGHALAFTVQFSFSGHDVGCHYTASDGESFITFYMSRYGDAMTPDIIVEQSSTEISQVSMVLDASAITDTEIQFGDAVLNCKTRVFQLERDGTQSNSAITGCNIDGWAYKIRASWMARPEAANVGVSDFSARQTIASQHLKNCFDWRQSAQTPANDLEADFTSILLYSLQPLGVSYAADERPIQCVFERYSTDTEGLLITFDAVPETRTYRLLQYTIEGETPLPAITATPAPGLNDLIEAEMEGGVAPRTAKTWAITGSADGSDLSLFKEYEGPPSLLQFELDAIAILTGDLVSVGNVSRDNEGQISVNVGVAAEPADPDEN